MSATAISLGFGLQRKGEPGAGVKWPLPSPNRTVTVPSSVFATRRSGLPSWFTSAMAMKPGPFSTGTTCCVNSSGLDAVAGGMVNQTTALTLAARAKVAIAVFAITWFRRYTLLEFTARLHSSAANRIPFGQTNSMQSDGKFFHGADPKSAPAPVVTAIASAPQNVTRVAPLITLAPPSDAAHAPSAARKSREAPATTGIRRACGAKMTAKRGIIAPTAKLAAEDRAA